MQTSPSILVIVEGKSYEKTIINNIRRNFFNSRFEKTDYKVISLPASKNIYMLWKDINEDEYIDIVELLRESSMQNKELLKEYNRKSFSEIYLFFDYDKHQNNLPENVDAEYVLKEMLATFDNETEAGKLYLSYPMAESIRDFNENSCIPFSGNCFIGAHTEDYKNISGNGNPLVYVRSYTLKKWQIIINVFRHRLSCLSASESPFSLRQCKQFSPFEIFNLQKESERIRGKSIVLSAFPEFLIDYFSLDFLYRVLEDVDNNIFAACDEKNDVLNS